MQSFASAMYSVTRSNRRLSIGTLLSPQHQGGHCAESRSLHLKTGNFPGHWIKVRGGFIGGVLGRSCIKMCGQPAARVPSRERDCEVSKVQLYPEQLKAVFSLSCYMKCTYVVIGRYDQR